MPTVVLAGGEGELNFGDGSVVGLGATGDDLGYGEYGPGTVAIGDSGEHNPAILTIFFLQRFVRVDMRPA